MDSGVVSIWEVVASGDKNGLRLLLARGADVNQTNKSGQTPLILAVVSGQARLLPALLEAGADPLLHDNTGLNAIDWAERKGLIELASQLRERTGDATQTRDSSAGQEKVVHETIPPPQAETTEKNLADVEKSRRWIAGMKQRLDEQASRQQVEAKTSSPGTEATLETSGKPIEEASSQLAPVLPADDAPAVSDSKGRRSPVKKCPQCGTVYNSDLVAYCVYHVVPLVDIDAPVEEHKKKDVTGNNVLLWILVIITFLTAAIIGLTFFTPRGNQNGPGVAPSLNPTPQSIWKGTPVVEESLKTKTVDLPEAQTALKIQKQETVVVRVRIRSDGHVSSVQSVSGNEELRRAAMDAARKATFAANKLRGSETVGTITYTFNPQ